MGTGEFPAGGKLRGAAKVSRFNRRSVESREVPCPVGGKVTLSPCPRSPPWPDAVLPCAAMDNRRDIPDFAHDAVPRDTATPRDDRLPLLARAEVAARGGVGDRQVQCEAKRWGLVPARTVGPHRSPLYDPADVDRVARLRDAAHPSRDTAAPPDTATGAAAAGGAGRAAGARERGATAARRGGRGRARRRPGQADRAQIVRTF